MQLKFLEGSTVQVGNPDYGPDIANSFTRAYCSMDKCRFNCSAYCCQVQKVLGNYLILGLMNKDDVFYTLDTTDLEIGEYEYVCAVVHPYMVATIDH